MIKSFPLYIVALISLGLTSFAHLSVQGQPTGKAVLYQNQQRAFNLNILRPEIKLVEDAPMRCFLRIQIMRFIFVNKISDYNETANSIATECLEDTVNNSNQFSESQSNWIKNDILSLLRKYSPDLAAKAEKKYFTANSSVYDELGLDQGTDPNLFVDKIILKIAANGIPSGTLAIVDKLSKINPNAEFRLLSAVLSYYESHYKETYSGHTFEILSSDYLDGATPIELRKRFHNFTVKLGEAAISDPNNADLLRVFLYVMVYALPDIKQLSPDLYPKASTLYFSLNSKKSQREKERDEVLARIRESKDKLAQAISEAESAEEKDLKNTLWLHASQYALDQKKYRLSAELRLKMDIDDKTFKWAQNFFLIENILNPVLKDNDIESAEYVVNLVDDPDKKSEGIFKIAAKLVELKKQDGAFDKLNEGLKMVEKMDTGQPKIRQMLSAIPIALKIDKTRAFDIASEAVKVINRLPTPGPDDKPGSAARQKYVETVLTTVSHNLETAFRLLGKENMALAEPTSQGIQLKEWQLGVRIALEKERLYPLPPELNVKQVSKTN